MAADYLRRVEALEQRLANAASLIPTALVNAPRLEDVIAGIKRKQEEWDAEDERRSKLPLAEQIALAEVDHEIELADREKKRPPPGTVSALVQGDLNKVCDVMHRQRVDALRARLPFTACTPSPS